ncbi:MAG: glycoside hydrolase family 2 TIM barrel-domain containing protein [Luteolibacter sp.]
MRNCIFLPLFLIGTVIASAQSVDVLSPQTKDGIQSLNGQWSFKYLPSLEPGADVNFSQPDFSVSAWKTIPVPANWEIQGFAEPRYDDELQDGLGLYRRTFRIPTDWQKSGQRSYLRFEGVAFGYEVWVNGIKAGASTASAFNPHTFDVTDAIKPDPKADNVLAVKVTTKPHGWEFDINDDWSLSGIYRDVTLFSLPATHLQDLTTRSKLTDEGAVDLSVSLQVSQPDGVVRGKLLGPDGKQVSEFRIPLHDGVHQTVVRVENPRLWTAETPDLYRLQLTLSDAKDKPLQTIEKRIGLREVSIKDGILLLNGRPIKLRGVNHHDLSPKYGRAITGEEMRQDLDLMKKANINYVRSAHYPPDQHLLDLCDEMGFYVMDEVSIGKGEKNLNKAAYLENILARVKPTVTRDKNHASVIIWSIGNENPIADSLLQAGRLAKELDPSRPICYPTIGSYFEKNYERFPEYVDIYAPHYPGNTTLSRYARNLKRPLILTEYAHALGLATDRIQDQWDTLQKTPGFAGGSVWMFQDQGLERRSEKAADLSKPTEVVWQDEHRFFDSYGIKGADGIVYSDRTPQTDYWQLRKVYAPVQISAPSPTVKAGEQKISLTVENRHDFRSLAGMKLAWSLQRNGAEIAKGETSLKAAAHEKENAGITLNIPTDTEKDILTLGIRCIDENGLQITERAWPLAVENTPTNSWLASLPAGKDPKLTESDTELKIEHPNWVLHVKRATGELTLLDPQGKTLISGIYPHSGRKLTMAEKLDVKKAGTWVGTTLSKVENLEIKTSRADTNLLLAVSGSYPRPQPTEDPDQNAKMTEGDPLFDQKQKQKDAEPKKDEAFVGGYNVTVSANGTLTLSYHFTPKGTGRITEAGLTIALAPELTEFRWIGQGPYAGYPGKDRLNEFGIFHLNREDLHFEGNRRGTELAMLTTPSGSGIAMALSNLADVAVERDGDKTLLSHNAVISSTGNKGASPEYSVKADKTESISGGFTLIPLDNTWPAMLTRWFGKPAAAKNVFHPFYHSYDQ